MAIEVPVTDFPSTPGRIRASFGANRSAWSGFKQSGSGKDIR